MPRLRTLAALTLLAAAVLPLASCAPPDRTLQDGTFVIVAERVANLQMQALIEGTLVEVDGCVCLDTIHETYPIIFPAGTSVDGKVIRVPGFDEPFALGDVVSGGGGFVPMAEDYRPELPCRSDEIVVFNEGDAG